MERQPACFCLKKKNQTKKINQLSQVVSSSLDQLSLPLMQHYLAVCKLGSELHNSVRKLYTAQHSFAISAQSCIPAKGL